MKISLGDIERFKPALNFMSRFLIVYVVGNLTYGWFVYYYHPQPDPATIAVTRQSVLLINWLQKKDETEILIQDSRVAIVQNNDIIVRVFEGCNGLNVIIVFLSFIVAFSGQKKSILGFLAVGIIIIHLINLGRIVLLYYLAKIESSYFYYFHKYIFTSAIYAFVFLLWVTWIYKTNAGRQAIHKA